MALSNKTTAASTDMLILLKPLMHHAEWLAQLEEHWASVLADQGKPTDKIEQEILKSLQKRDIRPEADVCAFYHLKELISNLGSSWESRYCYVPSALELYDVHLTIESTSLARVTFRDETRETAVDGIVAITGIVADAETGKALHIKPRWISRPFWQAPCWSRDMAAWEPTTWVQPHLRITGKGRVVSVQGHARKSRRGDNKVLHVKGGE